MTACPATRREFLKRVVGGAGLAAVGSAAFANRHGHPSPQSIKYLDRKMYIHNMEVHARFGGGGEGRSGKMQMMSIGSRRYLCQGGDVIHGAPKKLASPVTIPALEAV